MDGILIVPFRVLRFYGFILLMIASAIIIPIGHPILLCVLIGFLALAIKISFNASKLSPISDSSDDE